jgi:hypothetical protein
MSKQRKEEAKKKLKEKRARAKILARREEALEQRRAQKRVELEMKKRTGLPEEEVLAKINANLKLLEGLEQELKDQEERAKQLAEDSQVQPVAPGSGVVIEGEVVEKAEQTAETQETPEKIS